MEESVTVFVSWLWEAHMQETIGHGQERSFSFCMKID